MRIYLDNCCYNRPFDDRSVIRNYLERESILLIFELAYEKHLSIVGSDVLEVEISNIMNIWKKDRVINIYNSIVDERVNVTADLVKRAKIISEKIGSTPYDSLHLALAENNVEYMITTDRKLERASHRMELTMEVINPIQFIMEVTKNDRSN